MGQGLSAGREEARWCGRQSTLMHRLDGRWVRGSDGSQWALAEVRLQWQLAAVRTFIRALRWVTLLERLGTGVSLHHDLMATCQPLRVGEGGLELWRLQDRFSERSLLILGTRMIFGGQSQLLPNSNSVERKGPSSRWMHGYGLYLIKGSKGQSDRTEAKWLIWAPASTGTTTSLPECFGISSVVVYTWVCGSQIFGPKRNKKNCKKKKNNPHTHIPLPAWDAWLSGSVDLPQEQAACHSASLTVSRRTQWIHQSRVFCCCLVHFSPSITVQVTPLSQPNMDAG